LNLALFKLKYDEPLSHFAFNLNFRLYNLVARTLDAAVMMVGNGGSRKLSCTALGNMLSGGAMLVDPMKPS
jgi:hypothetical protein